MYLKFLKSELYRASKLKSTYILIVVLFLISILMNLVLLKFDFLGALGVDNKMFMELTQEGSSIEGVNDAAQLGALMGGNMVSEGQKSRDILGEGLFYEDDIPTLFYMHVSDLNPIMLLAIFVGIFVGDIYSTGIGKNLIISNNRRGTLFAARVTTIAIYSLIIHIFTWIFTVIGAAQWAKSVDFAWSKNTVIYLFFSLYLTIAYSILVYAVTVITKSKAAGITIGVVLSTGVLATIISVANWAIITKLGLKSDFSVGNYMLTENLSVITQDFPGNTLSRGLIVATVYIIISVVAVYITNKKRDLA